MSSIPSGYKQTEVGVIPEDWEPTPLSDTCTLHNGRAYGLHEWERSGVPVIRLQNLTGGEDYYFSTLPLAEQKYCDYGDLLYMWSATFGPRIWRGGRAIYHYHIWKIGPKKTRASSEFLYYKLLEITDEKKARATNGGTMLHVTKASMEATRVALPPLPEQRAIAAALSDVDALLAKLDQFIAKKRDLKQAAMQRLLTGQTRLPGFSGAWVVKRLGDVADCLDNVRVPLNESERNRMKGDYPYCGANGVLDFVNDFVIDDDIILMAEDGGYFDEYSFRPIAYRMIGKCWVNNHAHVLKAQAGTILKLSYPNLVCTILRGFPPIAVRA